MREVTVARKMSRSAGLQPYAETLQDLLRARGDHDHVAVRAARGHLVIELQADDAPPDTLARASPLGGGDFGLSFRSHTGRWDPMPVVGSLEEVADGAVSLLGPYLDPQNL